MKFVTYTMDRKEQTGILSPDEMWIYPTASLIRPYPDMNALIRHISPEEFSLLCRVIRRGEREKTQLRAEFIGGLIHAQTGVRPERAVCITDQDGDREDLRFLRLPGHLGEDNGKDNRETQQNQNSQLDEIIFAFFLHDGPSCWYRLASSWLRAGSRMRTSVPSSGSLKMVSPYAGPKVRRMR